MNNTQKIRKLIREELDKLGKETMYFLRWTDDANGDIKRNFSGHMQAWFDTEKEAMDDYNERIADGKYVPYPPKKDFATGMWNSEPEWGLSGYGFNDEKSFNIAMNEIKDISWHHKDSLQQELVLFKSLNYILGDGFDGEDVFRNAIQYWNVELDMNYNKVESIITQ